jgi:hypothetical protein
MTVIAGACVWGPAHEIDMAYYLCVFPAAANYRRNNLGGGEVVCLILTCVEQTDDLGLLYSAGFTYAVS